jgi:hypothetical protein
VIKEALESRVRPDLKVQQEMSDRLGPPGRRVAKAHQVLRVPQDLKDNRVLRELQALLVPKVLPGPMELLGRREQLDLRVIKAVRESLALPVLRVRKVLLVSPVQLDRKALLAQRVLRASMDHRG